MNNDVKIIVAVGRNGEIGQNNSLIWHLRDDLRRFKRLTVGNTVVMGRKTFESLPDGALPDRRNIVLSRNRDYVATGAEVAGSLEEALRLRRDDETMFIIGGESIYREALPLVDVLEITEIDAEASGADAWFPVKGLEDFETVDVSEDLESQNGVKFRFRTLHRK